MTSIDWETWLVEDAGHSVIEKMATNDALSAAEKLTYCLWVADYGMRNAGDLATAADLYPPFHNEAAELAAVLQLPRTTSAFGLPLEELERSYFERFDEVCEEISRALGVPPRAI